MTKLLLFYIGLSATGVSYSDSKGKTHTAYIRNKGEIILSAGAIGSPQLLLLSGGWPKTSSFLPQPPRRPPPTPRRRIHVRQPPFRRQHNATISTPNHHRRSRRNHRNKHPFRIPLKFPPIFNSPLLRPSPSTLHFAQFKPSRNQRQILQSGFCGVSPVEFLHRCAAEPHRSVQLFHAAGGSGAVC